MVKAKRDQNQKKLNQNFNPKFQKDAQNIQVFFFYI